MSARTLTGGVTVTLYPDTFIQITDNGTPGFGRLRLGEDVLLWPCYEEVGDDSRTVEAIDRLVEALLELRTKALARLVTAPEAPEDEGGLLDAGLLDPLL